MICYLQKSQESQLYSNAVIKLAFIFFLSPKLQLIQKCTMFLVLRIAWSYHDYFKIII